MKSIFKVCFLFITINLFSQQIKIVDNDRKSIANVKAIDKTGKIIGVSDLEGDLLISDSNLTDIELYHSDFKSFYIDKLKGGEIIALDGYRENVLNEIIINSSNQKYLYIYANFYSYQLINGAPQSYIDGLIVYIINNNTKKLKKTKVLSQRKFFNSDLIRKIYKDNSVNYTTIGYNVTPLSFHEELLNSSDVKLVNDSIEISKYNNYLSKDPSLKITIEYNSPENKKERAILGLKSVISNHIITESFKDNNFELNKLSSISKYYKSDISQRKNNFTYELIQDIRVIKTLLSNNLENVTEDIDNDKLKVPNFINSLISEGVLKQTTANNVFQ